MKQYRMNKQAYNINISISISTISHKCTDVTFLKPFIQSLLYTVRRTSYITNTISS